MISDQTLYVVSVVCAVVGVTTLTIVGIIIAAVIINTIAEKINGSKPF
jgi:hypothetical protein